MKNLSNKLIALVLLLIGYLSIGVDGDGTFFVFSLLLGLPLFFSKKDWTAF